MKKLSDYKGEEAIELWADLIEMIAPIFTDDSIKEIVKSGKPKIEVAKAILSKHKSDAVKILLRIDPTPIDGLNVVIRLIELLNELGKDESITNFFGFAEQTDSESSGLLTENTGAEEK